MGKGKNSEWEGSLLQGFQEQYHQEGVNRSEREKNSRDKSGIYETDRVNLEEYGKVIILGLKKKTNEELRKWDMKKGRKFSEKSPYIGARKLIAARIKCYLNKNIHASYPKLV